MGRFQQNTLKRNLMNFFMIGEWNSEDDIATARPKMVAFLDTLRHTLEELSSDLGVTDPHSGTVVIEK